MDFNTILKCFGFEPEDFVDEPLCPIKADYGYIIEVKQRISLVCVLIAAPFLQL